MTATNRLAWGAAWLGRVLEEHASVGVTYRRGTRECAWNATVGQSDVASDQSEVPVLGWTSCDFIGPAADLILGGETVEPLAGDQIIRTLGGWRLTYMLVTPTGSLPWSWLDETTRERIRVHTQLVSKVRV